MTDIPRITTVSVLPTPAPVPVTLPKPVTLDAIRKIIREELRANAALEAAARQALEAWDGPWDDLAGGTKDFCVAMDALRAALAEPQHKPIPLNEGRLWQYSDGSIGVGTPAEPVQHSPATLIDPRGSLGEPIV